jgi:hypothetical protein
MARRRYSVWLENKALAEVDRARALLEGESGVKVSKAHVLREWLRLGREAWWKQRGATGR